MATVVDIDGAAAAAFGLADTHLAGRQTGFHAHARHQLLYCSEGALRLTLEQTQYLLPPARAAWLPEGVQHDVGSLRGAQLRTVYLAPRFGGPVGPRVFPMPLLGRELVLRATRFDPDTPTNGFGEAFFGTLVGLVHEWALAPSPLCLPRARSAEVAAAMSLVLARIERPPQIGDAARAAGVHPRTLRRRFHAETGMTYRDFVRDARTLTAMDLLSDASLSVTEVAFAVGYETPSAFANAFRALTGLSPSQFRAGSPDT